MAIQTQPRTTVTKVLTVGKEVKKAEDITKETGRPLGSPINGYEEGQQFKVTLTGKIEIREFQGQKGAYFTTKEGISIRVNAGFDPAVHKEGATMDCICRTFPRENGTSIKFAAFAN